MLRLHRRVAPLRSLVRTLASPPVRAFAAGHIPPHDPPALDAPYVDRATRDDAFAPDADRNSGSNPWIPRGSGNAADNSRRGLFEHGKKDLEKLWQYLPGKPQEWNTSQNLWRKQDLVEPLPLPAVEETFDRFEKYVSPLLTETQLERAQIHIHRILSTGQADELQDRLHRIASENATGSYIEGMWNSMYLDLRCPQPINTTPFLLLGLDQTSSSASSDTGRAARGRGNQLERAAAVAFKAADFESRIRAGTLTQDEDRAGPLDSTQYTRLFSYARIPVEGRDLNRFSPPNLSRHIVVMRNNHMFAVDVLEEVPVEEIESNGDSSHNSSSPQYRAIPEDRIFAALQAVVRNSSYSQRERERQMNLARATNAKPRFVRHRRFDPETGAMQPHANIGVLTSMDRDSWAGARQQLMDSHHHGQGVSANRRSLSVIQSALFVLCLDVIQPRNLSEMSRHLLAAPTNRWWDKTQFVVTPGGDVGMLLEHTVVDGHAAIRVCDEISQHLRESKAPPIVEQVAAYREQNRQAKAADSLRKLKDEEQQQDDESSDDQTTRASDEENGSTNSDAQSAETPASVSTFAKRDYVTRAFLRELDFIVSDSIQEKINDAVRGIRHASAQTDICVVDFHEFGTSAIKTAGVSPDAFVQMAFQLAYYRTYNKLDSTYESANTKCFRAGRTETLRVVTPQSSEFVKLMTSDFPSDAQLSIALRTACAAHVQRMKEAKSGHGVDRHLYALKQVAHQLQAERIDYFIPQFFLDASYKRLTRSVLSTSNVSHPCFHLFGFGPVVPEGLGIAYNTHTNAMFINITSFTNEASRYGDAVRRSLTDMMELLKRTEQASDESNEQA